MKPTGPEDKTFHSDTNQSHLFILFIFLFFWRTHVLFVGPLIPLFWTSGDICFGFQSQGGSCLHTFLPEHYSSDSTLAGSNRGPPVQSTDTIPTRPHYNCTIYSLSEPDCWLKPCSHITFVSACASNVKNGVHCSK